MYSGYDKTPNPKPNRTGRAARWRLDDPAVLLTEIAERQNEKSNKANANAN